MFPSVLHLILTERIPLMLVLGPRLSVDENLYYRSIKKDDADHSRRDQTHGLPRAQLLDVSTALPSPDVANSGETFNSTNAASRAAEVGADETKKETHVPPFLFRNANGLLNMTRQHNVRLLLSDRGSGKFNGIANPTDTTHLFSRAHSSRSRNCTKPFFSPQDQINKLTGRGR